jgi:DNA polymerase elongation subunit (family B)
MSSNSLSFSQNQMLFGWNETSGIVALELEGDQQVRLYRKISGKIVVEHQNFRPVLWLAKEDLLKDFKADVEIARLAGNLTYCFLAVFKSWKDVNAAKRYIAKNSGQTLSDRTASYLFLSDPIHQHLLTTGQTSFRGLKFADLNRLQLDIEAYCTGGFEFAKPERKEDCIIAIALSDSSGWETVLWGKEMTEPEMLQQLNKIIQERDPDIIEGHNIYKFDLNYLKIRADRHGIRLKWGRNGSEPTVYESRLQIAERTIDYPKWEIYGRHIIDTWILSQFYDITTRELESLSLKEMAKHFDLAGEERTYIEGGQISRVYDENPSELYRYALDDVRETRGLSQLLSQSYFIQAQIFPYSFQNIIVRGNATKINALFTREYLRQRHCLPAPPGESREFAGGYTDIFYEGVVKNVVHCDVASLYPSIMLAKGFKPANDELDVFLPLLCDLRTFRLEAKRLSQRVESAQERAHFQALQATFKILINSFYGYLGTFNSNFADFQVAGSITEAGRQILKQMIEWLKRRGCQVVEIDTDGIYFVPPSDVGGPDLEKALIKELAGTLPAGIDIEFDGRYKAMLSYKMKNYALLTYDDKIIIKGSGLRSRGLERFQREFLRKFIHLLLMDEAKQIPPLLEESLSKMERHEFDISQICKTEVLSESLTSYQLKIKGKKRNPSALYELALRSDRDYQPGDPISYYVTGNKKNVKVYESCKLASQWDPLHPDENIPYYKAKLNELFEKFKPFLPDNIEPGQKELKLE